MSAASEFVSKLLLARDRAHLAHWSASGPGSYAAHVALEEFYDKILELTDEFVEQYQGAYQELLKIKITAGEDGDMLPFLADQASWIDAYRSEICDLKDSELQNTIDEVLRVYEKTLYKLKFLK